MNLNTKVTTFYIKNYKAVMHEIEENMKKWKNNPCLSYSDLMVVYGSLEMR